MEIPIRKRGDGITLEVHLTPKASRDRIDGVSAGRLRVSVASPPVEGEANRALIALLSRVLKAPRSRISILKGRSSRNKVVLVSEMDEEQARRLLGERLG